MNKHLVIPKKRGLKFVSVVLFTFICCSVGISVCSYYLDNSFNGIVYIGATLTVAFSYYLNRARIAYKKLTVK